MATNMDNEMNEWLEDSASQKIAIWCEDPEIHHEKIAGGMMEKEYVTYRILMKQVGRDIVGVRHRYSEFEALRNSLKEQYGHLGIAVPSLPPKALIVSPALKESFLRERTLGLSIFCELIVASVWLRNDRKWMEFMNPNSMGGVDRSNIGETKLCACLMMLELPYKNSIVQKVDEVKQEILSIEKYAKFMLEKARNLQASERAYSTAQESMSEAFTLWYKNEQTTSSLKKIFGGRVFEDSHPVLNDPLESPLQTLSHLSNFVTTTMNCNEHRHDYTGLSLVMIMEQELAMVESVKDLLRVHEEMLLFIDSMKSRISKTEASRSANRFEQAAEQRKVLEGRQNGLVAFYKGFLYFTVPLTVRQRAASFRRFSAVHAASQLTIAYSLQLACVQFFKDLRMRPSSVINDTCGMLELLKLKRLAQIPPIPEDSISTTSSVLVDYRLCPSSTGMAGLYRRAFAVSPPDVGSNNTTIPATNTTITRRKDINSVSDNVTTVGVSTVASSVDSNTVAVKHSDGSAGHDTSLMTEMDEAPEDFDSSDPQPVEPIAGGIGGGSSAASSSSSSDTTYSSSSLEESHPTPPSSSSSSYTTTTASTTIVVSEKTQQLLAELTESVYNRPASAVVKNVCWE